MSWRTLAVIAVDETTTPLATTIQAEAAAPALPSFYELFKDHGVIKEIMPCIAAYLFLLLFGLYGNFSVAYCTFRHKQLHGTCGILLSVGAIGDLVHQFSHFYMLYLMFSGTTFTYLQTCVIVNTIPIIGLNFGLIMSFFIAFDRFFSVVFPAKHRIINKTLYISALFGVIIVFNAVMLVQIYINMAVTPFLQTPCFIVDAMPGGVGQTWFTFCIICNFSTIGCYIIVWIALKLNTKASDATRRIFKSLFVLAMVVLVGWSINGLIQVYLRATGTDPISAWFIAAYAGLPVNIACSSNYFVLYYFSKDYKTAFRRQVNGITKTLFGKELLAMEGDMRIQNITVTNTVTNNGDRKNSRVQAATHR